MKMPIKGEIYNESDCVAENFCSNPETFPLFRGEGVANRGGLHFTTDKNWAKNFGDNILAGRLPAGSNIKIVMEIDMKDAYTKGITSERALWDSIFEKGYDAVVGTDLMNSNMLDVIVHPKHLKEFRPSSIYNEGSM